MHQLNLSAIDLNLLVALDALIDEVNVGRAARRVARSQPAMSRTLSRLRELFGDPLLVKQGRAMVLTPRAHGLREPLKRLLGDTGQLLRPPAPFDPARERRHFKLISSDYLQVVLLGAVLEHLGRAAPDVTLSVLAPTTDPFEALATGKADLFFGPPLHPDWCEAALLLADPWLCVRRRGAPLPRRTEAYLALDHVDVMVEQRFGGPIADALGPLALRRRVRAVVPDFAGAMFVVSSSQLTATVPRPVALRAVASLPVVAAPAPLELAAATVSMVWPRRATSDPAHAWLRDAVREAIAQHLVTPRR